MIDVSVGQENAGDGRIPGPADPWAQRRKTLDLRWQIRRSVHEPPGFTIAAQSDAGLALPGDLAFTGELTIRAVAIPLWQSAAGGTAEHINANGAPSLCLDRAGVTRAFEKDRHVFHGGFDPTLFGLFHFHLLSREQAAPVATFSSPAARGKIYWKRAVILPVKCKCQGANRSRS
jgi:hypothetical protein